ncbi:hypothetical protein [Staphylothermus hellenicus]|uniref:Uncharacterized protein n=1 Tax=Staphylothermus hellenicus (strain DSM 12710 / JCM 10830 / BK20S6-10-b1 / P8) TaxID=591019 RepID=D7D8A5_STAHD|nr:hypothetical protein [Staphylothermus hellenicus]ADI32001.1 hypothetical protein Shell_0892 [Staphylothermus hellenicus DSM 12710]
MMDSAILDFRTLLSILAFAYALGIREFTARDVHKLFISLLSMNPPSKPDSLLKVLSRIRLKLISNDLRRLYFMGFLKRRRVKRLVRTRSGKTCYRGYEYKYSISSQGWKYIRYLANPDKEDKEDAKGWEDLLALQIIEKTVPKEMREIAGESWKAYFSRRRGSRRFSTSKAMFWDKLIEAKYKLIREGLKDEVKELAGIAEKLIDIVNILLEKYEALKKENARLKEMLKKTLTLPRNQ